MIGPELVTGPENKGKFRPILSLLAIPAGSALAPQ